MSTVKIAAIISWLIISIFYSYQYILRVMPNIMLNDIMFQYNMDVAIFGQFSGIYYIGYALMHLPIGIMLDRYGTKKIVPLSIMLTVIGLLPLIFSNYYIYPILGRLLIGIGSSTAILGVFKIVRLSFSEKYFTRMLSISVTIGLIGAIYGGGPLAYMNTMLGYQTVIKLLAIFGTMLAFISYLFLPHTYEHDKSSIIANIKLVFTNKKVLVFCVLSGLMVGPLEGFADVWAAEFLKQVYQFDDKIAGSLPSLIFLGMCFGGLILSTIATKTNSYLGVIIGCGMVMLSIFITLLLKLLTFSTMTIAFVILGICCAYQILAIYKASTYVEERLIAITTALANMIIMSFGYGFHSVIGLVINNCCKPLNETAFVYGITVIPIALAIAILGYVVGFAKRN